jgi:ABC-type bacteriocin/lantibiotic exporter with double-glycine peptidase domain
MSEIEATKIVDNIESLLLCMFENNIKIHKTINEFRSVFYNKNLYSKYFLNLFINYNEAIDLKLEILRKLIEISLENIEIFKVEQIENKFIYDTFLKYEDNNQIMNVNLYSDSEILYKLENLSFAYYNNYIIKDVNCIIPKNKWISLYGNSGCGKTTFINLLIKNIEPLTGTISYMGVYPMFTYESIKKDISYVTSIPELFDESILYNITYSLKNPKSEEVINTINKYMILFKLDKYKENLDTTNIKFLSTGEKQRLQIIRLILIDKPIWLLDELTSNINNELEIIILEELKRIQVKKNKSVIHITHNLENLEFCDYKMYIKHSSIYIA